MLLVGGDGVDGGEGEAEEAVGFVLGEFGGNGLGEFDGLAGYGCAAYVDGVAVDVAAGGTAVAVADGPGFAGEGFGGGGFGGGVDGVVGLFVGGEFGRKDPAGVMLAVGRGSRVWDTNRSEDPVSKSKFKV